MLAVNDPFFCEHFLSGLLVDGQFFAYGVRKLRTEHPAHGFYRKKKGAAIIGIGKRLPCGLNLFLRCYEKYPAVR
jgi:hypothetical protein